jgi:LysR family transcriptional regulator, nitrogen assimilation regulatory protein
MRYFITIYEAGSVTKASARLLIAQSALSQQLAQLEDELGVQLFTRSPHGVSPTAFGEMFYEQSLEILQRLSDAVESVRQLGQNPRGTVAVGMPETISITLGLPLLQSVKQRFPDVYLRLTENLSANLRARLKEGRLDLLIMHDDGMCEGLSARPLVTERLYLVSLGSAASAGPVTLSDALASPLVLPDVRDGLRTIIDTAARTAGLAASNRVLEVSSLTVIKNAVLQGVGATILPLSCVSAEIRQGTLREREITNPEVHCNVILYTRKDALLAQAATAVFTLAVATANQLCIDKHWIGGAIAQQDNHRQGASPK